MNLRGTIKKILKEELEFSTQFKRRITLFKEFIHNCFVFQNPCDYEDFTHFMMGIHSEIQEYASGIYDDDVPDWLTYEEGVDFVETYMIDELKEYYYEMCPKGDLYEETSSNKSEKDLSPYIEKLLQSIVERDSDIICGVEVTAPWNRKTIEPDKSFKQYKILVKFIGGPGTEYYPMSYIDQDMYENIINEMWSATYNYLGVPADVYSKKSKKCEDTEKEEMIEGELTERCWKGYTQKGMKTMFGKRYPNCVKKKK
jgi:hypothetical protein